MVSIAIVSTTMRLRQLFSSLLDSFVSIWANRDQRHKFLCWISGGTIGASVLLLILEASRGFCRTPKETAQLLAGISRTLLKTILQIVARGFKPKFPKWTLRYELLHGLMRSAANMFGDRIVDVQHARVIRHHSGLFGTFLGWFACWQHGLRLESIELNGLEHLWLKSKTSLNSRRDKRRLVVLFYHGGGYAVLSPRMYISFCSTLVGAIKHELVSDDVDIDIFLANYRKLPEHRFPVPAEDAVSMYEYLLQHEKLEPSQIIVAGDSAGGGLVMSVLLRVRDGLLSRKKKLPLPLAAILMCPLADLTHGENEIASQNCILPLNMIAASVLTYHPTHDDPKTWADASPVHCNLRDLPPIFLQAATFDSLYQHSVRLHAKAIADGVVNWEYDVHEGVPHVFMVIPSYILPYAHVGVQKMAVFAAQHFAAKHEGLRCKENEVGKTHKVASGVIAA
ncbi:putative alpha/beta hydrolase-3, lipase, GDXG serine active [Plasmopara halstedii]